MVRGKPEYQKSYQEDLIGQVNVMCAIKTVESIVDSTTLVVNIYDYISALRRATIHPEAVKLIWKKVGLVSHLSGVYQSMYFGMYLVHVRGHHNSGRPGSTLTSLASLNVRLDALA